MSQHDTGVQCPACLQDMIVAEVESLPTESPMLMPIGPNSGNFYQMTVTSFHCLRCQTMFFHPPGEPNAAGEILDQIRGKKAEEEWAKLKEDCPIKITEAMLN